MRIAFFFPIGTEIVHTVYQFFNVFLPAQVLRRTVLINIIDDTRLADNVFSQLVGSGMRNRFYKSGNQITECLQFGVSAFRQRYSISQRFVQHLP